VWSYTSTSIVWYSEAQGQLYLYIYKIFHPNLGTNEEAKQQRWWGTLYGVGKVRNTKITLIWVCFEKLPLYKWVGYLMRLFTSEARNEIQEKEWHCLNWRRYAKMTTNRAKKKFEGGGCEENSRNGVKWRLRQEYNTTMDLRGVVYLKLFRRN